MDGVFIEKSIVFTLGFFIGLFISLGMMYIFPLYAPYLIVAPVIVYVVYLVVDSIIV